MKKNILIGILVLLIAVSGIVYAYSRGLARAEIRALRDDLAFTKEQQNDKDTEISNLKDAITDQEKTIAGIARDNEVLKDDLVKVRVERDQALDNLIAATNSEIVETTKEILEEDTIYLRKTYVEFSFSAARNNAGKLTEWRSFKFDDIPRLTDLVAGKEARIKSEVAKTDLILQREQNWIDKFNLSQQEVADWRNFYKEKKKATFWKGLGGTALAFLAGMLVEGVLNK